MKTLIGYEEDDGGEDEPPDSGDDGNEEPPEPPPVGEEVLIVRGPFTDFEGIIENINWERAQVRVRINFFGRETPVELNFDHVKKREADPKNDN